MVILRLVSSNQKVLFERMINKPIDEIPFSKIIDVLDFLYDIPHDTIFIKQDISNINLKIK